MKENEIKNQRRDGMFYTPLPFAKKALEYIEQTLGKNWWKSGEYRLWDMAAGTGNLEYYLPKEALKYCYLSTLYQEEVDYLERLFPHAKTFQYNYLEDDVNHLFIKNGNIFSLNRLWKMPDELRNDLSDPKLKWIILINPPFATAQAAKKHKGTNKIGINNTAVCNQMHYEKFGKASEELFVQFIYRIKKEFSNRISFLGLFSTLKYLNAESCQKFREQIFDYIFLRGFMFSSSHFHGTTKKNAFPVGFLVWDLSKHQSLDQQSIILDIFDEQFIKTDTKQIVVQNKEKFLNKWILRPAQTILFPPGASAININPPSVAKTDRIADGFLASLMIRGNDFQNQNYTAFLSFPYINGHALSVTSENFEQAMVIHASIRIPKATWINDRDQFFMPYGDLSKQFITDCTVWSLFNNSNQTASLRNVEYKGKIYQIENHFFPFSALELTSWIMNGQDIKTIFFHEVNGVNEIDKVKDSFVTKWLSKREISTEAEEVLKAAKKVYHFYFDGLSLLQISKFKIETYDAGWWQIRNALQDAQLGNDELAELKFQHNKLKEKLLPQLKEYGMIR
jgi:hypothetical protein